MSNTMSISVSVRFPLIWAYTIATADYDSPSMGERDGVLLQK